jgi:galactonate dehydratase
MPNRTIARLALTHARISPKTIWSFITLTLADGTLGCGEASLMRSSADLDAPFRAARRALEGAPVAAAHAYARDDAAAPLAVAAIAGAVEQAAQDAVARADRQSVVARLGGDPAARIPVYANINRRTLDRTPAGFAASAAQAMQAGFTAVKIAPFDDVTPAIATSPEGRRFIDAGLARAAAVKATLGPERELFVDCHWRFPVAIAADVGDALAERGVTWFECPIAEAPDAIADLKRLRHRANVRGMRLAGLEELPSPAAFRPFLAAGAYDVVMPDVKYAGGLRGLLAVAADAHAHGVACAPHNPTGPVCHAASLVACAAAHLPLLEHQFDESPLFFMLAGTSLPRPAGGTCALPAGPGLGVDLDFAALAANDIRRVE